jgi:2-methylisocitrate lyase-like PEP mutase family enzyme
MNNFKRFFELHHRQQPLVIANAWNAKSAQGIEKAGFEAIATSSGAIADSLGYKDGEQIPFGEMLYIISRITSVAMVPVSVDMERGYTDDVTVLIENIQKLIDLGVAGINIEDHQGEEVFLKKLNAINNFLEQTNQELFVNARTDVFLQKIENPIQTVISRAARYKDAGADGLFVTGVQDTEMIKEIVSGVRLPVNVVGIASIASVPLLADCGVKRISMAGMLYSAGYRKIQGLLGSITSENSFKALYQP